MIYIRDKDLRIFPQDSFYFYHQTQYSINKTNNPIMETILNKTAAV